MLYIEPSKGWVSLKLKELWQYRELLYFLTWRDIKVRYKQTALGVAWAIIQPMFTMLIFSLFFGRLAKMFGLRLLQMQTAANQGAGLEKYSYGGSL